MPSVINCAETLTKINVASNVTLIERGARERVRLTTAELGKFTTTDDGCGGGLVLSPKSMSTTLRKYILDKENNVNDGDDERGEPINDNDDVNNEDDFKVFLLLQQQLSLLDTRGDDDIKLASISSSCADGWEDIWCWDGNGYFECWLDNLSSLGFILIFLLSG